jgi:hypothetical protein
MKSQSLVPRFAKTVVLLATAMVAFAGTAQAQSKGVVAGAREKTISVYKSPTDAEPSETLAAQGFPWPILDESREGFLLVTVGGKKVWVDPMDVMANRESVNRCSKGLQVADIAGQPGAANRCK